MGIGRKTNRMIDSRKSETAAKVWFDSFYVRIFRALISQAARQGLAVLMATAVVVLKHETSTTYQSHIYESIELKFGLGDNVTRFSNPAKFSE